ncbi:uncharacterized protein [Haliotis cracherodii]|uniref:uncharacterized protein n=1 Tax=Haliotis cracherodii TaxID=6455 RepID=UPI0039ED0122
MKSDSLWILKQTSFDFDNIVFEGGGAKGIAYMGTLEVLQEVGIYDKLHRFAGVSMGAVFATLMALGFTPREVKEFSRTLDASAFLDATCGYLAFLPNLAWSYGWHPAKKFYNAMSEQIREKHGDSLLTFGKLYHDHGKELCIVAANMSTSSVEYFHPKTTPDFPIMEALAMSFSIPVVMKPKYSFVNGRGEYFVDGGVLNNYPINTFDGWYLSMDPKHSFLHHDNIEEEQSSWFDGFSEKTIGAMVFSTDEREVFKREFGERTKDYPPDRPNTALMRKRLPHMTKIDADNRKQDSVKAIAHKLMACLRERNLDQSMHITKTELTDALKSSDISPEEYKLLFGNTKPDKVFDEIDRYGDDFVSVHALVSYFAKRGVPIHHGAHSRPSHAIDSLTTYMIAIIDSITARHKEVVIKRRDLERSIGIDCDYITTMDDLEEEDIDFLITQGRNATIAFLNTCMEKKPKAAKPQTD